MEKQQEEIKEEFAQYCNTDNFSAPPYETDTITDWWLQKLDLAVAEERKRIVDMIGKTEPAPVLDVYLDKVKNGNKDDMYDYGVKITREMCVSLITKEN